MQTFLIQTIYQQVKHDFSFALLEAIEYHRFMYPKQTTFDVRYCPLDATFSERGNPKEYVPVGSVEFVHAYFSKHFGVIPAPIQIPKQLMLPEYLGREARYGDETSVKKGFFYKKMDAVKTQESGWYKGQPLEPCYYFSSAPIEIQSEWRAFFYKKELVGLQSYLGDFTVFPDVPKIKEMLSVWDDKPIAGTLDVGIVDGQTVIIECHNFYSCGLYGFSNTRILPWMFVNWYYEFLEKNGIHKIRY